jgi:hypothetical protein
MRAIFGRERIRTSGPAAGLQADPDRSDDLIESGLIRRLQTAGKEGLGLGSWRHDDHVLEERRDIGEKRLASRRH